MRTVAITREMIDRIKREVGGKQVGLAAHSPEPWAEATNCFRNVSRQVREAGGRARYGWTFHHRLAQSLPGMPMYLYITHHAVWNAPDGRLIDVTPYPEERHKPYMVEGSTLFMLDSSATPGTVGGQPAPLRLRYFVGEEADGLAAYIEELNVKEQKAVEELRKQVEAQVAPREG